MKPMTRRQVLKLAGGATAIVPLATLSGRQGFAADMVQVDPEDATAKALEYVHASPNPEQQCKTANYTRARMGRIGDRAISFPTKSSMRKVGANLV